MHLYPKTAVRLTAGLLIVSTLAVPALALTGVVDVGSSTLRVRSEPNTTSSVLAKLRNGTEVDILSESTDGWYEIAFGDSKGYVSSDYVVVNSPEEMVSAVAALSPTAVSNATEAAAAQPAAEAQAQPEVKTIYVRVTASALNVRSGPGTNYDKVSSLRAGRVVKVVSDAGNGWYQVEQGYISKDYVIQVDESEATASAKGQEVANYALTFVGYPYVYGGSSPKGFDCSGFAKYIYAQFGVTINRTASNQMDNGTAVSMGELQPGDLVFFKKSGTGSKRASHVGIYIGGGQFVHASTARTGVIVSNMSDAYYTTGFVGGRRLV